MDTAILVGYGRRDSFCRIYGIARENVVISLIHTHSAQDLTQSE